MLWPRGFTASSAIVVGLSSDLLSVFSVDVSAILSLYVASPISRFCMFLSGCDAGVDDVRGCVGLVYQT